MEAEIIAVGTELLSFARSETNSLYITRALFSLGIEIRRKIVVGDRPRDLHDSLLDAVRRSDVIVFSGGLGPTTDDITRESVASALNRPLRLDSRILDDLAVRYRKFGFKLTENNRRQAMVPEGAEIMANPFGTAPGIFLEEKGTLIFLLPGPPRELYPMVDNHLLRILNERKGLSPIPSRLLKIAGEAESRVDAAVSDIYTEYRDVETTILSSPGIISLYFIWKGARDDPQATGRLKELSNRIRERIGRSVYSEKEESIEEKVGSLLAAKGLSLAAAESCTGGLIAKLITDVPGSSAYFLGGVAAYSNEVKIRVLGVDPGAVAKRGAVSRDVAEEMADGVRRLTGSDIGISTTGIAGPGGGSDAKPVGTVFLGLSYGPGVIQGGEPKISARKHQLPGTREAVRLRSSRMALDWVRRILDP